MSLLFIPLYIHYLGIEAYGLIGIFTMLQIWLSILDAGLTPTLGREMARFRGGVYTLQRIHELVRALEWIFVIIAVAIILIVRLISPWLASDWLKLEKLTPDVVENALAVSGVVIGSRWLAGLYRSGINGLQNQVSLNVIIALFATFRGLGVVLVLKYISPSIQVFFIYQAIIALIEAIFLREFMKHILSAPKAPVSFNIKALKEVKRFAAGMITITIFATILTQADKLIISKLISLADFGHYALASSVAGGLYFIIQPLSNTIRPRLAELVASEKSDQISISYHKFSQLITLTIVPTALVIAVFSDHLMLLWTRDIETTKATALIITLLVIGNMLNGLMNAPYALQLAFGKTRFAIWANFVAVVILIPGLLVSVQRYGTIAAPVVWVLLNTGYMLIIIPVMHKTILVKDMWLWYWKDVAFPALSALIVIAIFYLIAPSPDLNKPLVSILILVFSGILSLLASIFAAKHIRDELNILLVNFKFQLRN